MKKYLPLATLSLALLVACSPAAPPAKKPADLVIRGALIWTGEPTQPWAEALAVSGDKITAVGSDEEISARIGDSTEVISNPAGLVVPGFIDSHVHMMESGAELSGVQLRDAATPAEFSQRIGDFANFLQTGEWVLGGTWDHQNWGGELPHREWIDALTPDTPVMVVRLDGHMVLANSKALALAGVDANTADVEGGEIVRDDNGIPTGVLKDNAMNLVAAVVPPLSVTQQDQALQQAMAYLAERGVTSVHDMGYSWDSLAVYRRNHKQGQLATRIYASVPLASWERLAADIASKGNGDAWLRTGGLKGFIDGSLGSHTAAFFEPFTDTPDDRGFFITPPADIERWAIDADAQGLQLLIHAIGDRANASLLDVFAKVIAVNPQRDHRFRIEHAQHLRPTEIDRFADLGIIASMQPYHAIDDGRWAESVIGPERSRYTYAFRSLLDAGATVTFGSDWSVAPASPIEGIYAATTRQTLDGEHPKGWVPRQKISVEEALIAYTRTGAYASFEEAIKGTLKVGKLADIVLLDQDITAIPLERIRDTRVTRTIIGGVTRYQLEDSSP